MNAETNRKILCIDPDSAHTEKLSELLILNGFDTETAASPGTALEKMMSFEPMIVVTELILPGTDILTLLRSLRRVDPAVVVIILTNQEERRKGSDRRLGQIFEYLEKSVKNEVLIGHIGRAAAFYKEKKATVYYTGENEARMQYQLEWLLWKQKSKIQEKMNFTGLILDTIKHSISQGMGVGSIVTLSELMEMDRVETGERYSVSRSIVDSLIGSGRMLHQWLQGLDSLNQDFHRDYPQEILTGETVKDIVVQSAKSLSALAGIKGHNIETGAIGFTGTIAAGRLVLSMAMRELLTNALKYSPERTPVDVIHYRSGNSMTIAVLNDILPMGGGITGIPAELENDIFEPFYRINNVFDERFQEGRSGMGLGLTMIQKAVSQVGGRLFIHEITDHSGRYINKRIIAEMIFPYEAAREVR